MNLKKSSYFKQLCLLVIVLFTAQCISIERKFVSTEEKVIENASPAYVYELEKIKNPSVQPAQDPIIEYRIVKFPAHRVELINTYQKIRKTNRFFSIFGGCIAGALIGTIIGGYSARDDYEMSGALCGFLIGIPAGGLITGGIISKTKSGIIDEIKETTWRYLQKKTDSTPIPAKNLPLEFKWKISGKINAFKTQTNEQGIVSINLSEDLKITKFPLDHPLILYIYYINLESQIKGILRDSLGPGK